MHHDEFIQHRDRSLHAAITSDMIGTHARETLVLIQLVTWTVIM